MSDDRLFASNNAIGRKWYYINILILAILTAVTELTFREYIIPNIKSDVYELIAKGMMYFAYVIYLITFFALIDRRLYDICGERDTKGYTKVSSILKFTVCFQLLILVCRFLSIDLPVSLDMLQGIAWIFNGIFLAIVFILGFFKGKISSMTYEQYKNKIKYKV